MQIIFHPFKTIFPTKIINTRKLTILSSKQQVLCHWEGKINIDIILIVMMSSINNIIYVTVTIHTIFPWGTVMKITLWTTSSYYNQNDISIAFNYEWRHHGWIMICLLDFALNILVCLKWPDFSEPIPWNIWSQTGFSPLRAGYMCRKS